MVTKCADFDSATVEAFRRLVRGYAELSGLEIPASRLIDTLDIEVAGHVFGLLKVGYESANKPDYDVWLEVDADTAYRSLFPLLTDGHETVTAEQVLIELEKLTVARNLRALMVAYSQIAPLYCRYGDAPLLSHVRVQSAAVGERVSFNIGADRFSINDEGDSTPQLMLWRSADTENSYSFTEGGRGLSTEGLRLLEQALFPGGKAHVRL